MRRTKEYCRAEALKYQTRVEFKTGSNATFQYVVRYGWLDEICAHMPMHVGEKTKAECHAEALKYQTRGEFRTGSRATYQYAVRYGWLYSICGHMVSRRISRRISDRLVYKIYSDTLRIQYIGLTNDLKHRFNGRGGHYSGRNKKITALLAAPDVEIDTIHEFCDQETACELEIMEIAKAHSMPGWTTLNKRKGGQL